jgi:beta-glucosidase
LLQKILRDEWGFGGLIMSDWVGNNNRVRALNASSDLEMPSSGGETDREVEEAIIDKTLNESVLDECVERTVALALDLYKEKEEKTFDVEAHHNFAMKAAEEE